VIRQASSVPTVTIAQNPEAGELLGRDSLALVLGMMLDQHCGPGVRRCRR
jgi:hypothetical protein